MNHSNQQAFNLCDKAPRSEREKRIYNLIILDESGSMGSIRQQALSGANETIQAIKAAQKESPEDHQMLSFVTFDSSPNRPDVRAIISCKPIDEVPELTENDYNPRGCTPLYDAMGLSINSIKANVQDGDSVLVTVITDGYENSSREFSASMVKALVDELRAKGWLFTYIGANQNSVEVAGELGIHATMDFHADITGTAIMYDKMSSSRREFYKKARQFRKGEISYQEMTDDSDFFSEKAAANRITRDHIDTLQPDEVFVFGSNLDGQHIGGAARIAVDRFGAIWGQGVGLQGQSYAIPTMSLSLEEIRHYVNEFIMFADMHPEKKFLVTRIGCGIAGFRDEVIAPLFAKASCLPNVFLPASFWKILIYRFNR